MPTYSKLITDIVPEALDNFSSEPLARLDHQHIRKEQPSTTVTTPKVDM